MELLYGLIPLFILAVIGIIIILPIVAIAKAGSIGRELEELRTEVRRLREKLADHISEAQQAAPQPPPQPVQQPEPEKYQEPEEEAPPQTEVPPTSVEMLMLLKQKPEIEPWPTEQLPAAEPPSAVEPEPEPEPEIEVEQPQPARETRERVGAMFSTSAGPAASAPSRAPQQPASRSLAEWEMIIGGNIVNRLAAIVLMIVSAFFLKYAYDQGWVTRPLIVVIGFIFGCALIYLGARFHRANAQIFAQGLLGAGISVLYLSGYATFSYKLVDQSLALLIMSAVTVVALITAVKFDSLVVSILGLLGGFLTPALLGGGPSNKAPNYAGLFIYLALLDFGLLAMVVKKDSWVVIEPLAFIATVCTYAVAHCDFSGPNYYATTISFLAAIWTLFYVMDVYRIVKSIQTYSGLRMAISVASSLFFYIGVYAEIGAKHPHITALFSFGLALAYFATLLVLMHRRREDQTFIARYVLTAITLTVIATAIQFDGFIRISLWAAEALLLAWAGVRWKVGAATGAAVTLFGLAVVFLIANDGTFALYPAAKFIPVWNLRFLAFAVFALTTGLAAAVFGRSNMESKGAISGVFQFVSWASILTLLAVETNDGFGRLALMHPHSIWSMDYTAIMAIAAIWIVYSTVVSWYGLRWKISTLPYLGLITLALGASVAAMSTLDVNSSVRLVASAVRVPTFAVIIAGLWIHFHLFGRRSEEYVWVRDMQEGMVTAGAALLFELLSIEIWAGFRRTHIEPFAYRDLARYLALGSAWAIYSIPLVWFALRKRYQVTMVLGLGVLAAGVAVIATRGADFAPISKFTLFTNIRVAAFTAAGLALLSHYWLFKRRIEEYDWIGAFLDTVRVIASLLIFELLTIETWAFFDKAALASLTAGATAYLELTRYMVLGMVWLAYSLPVIWLALRQKSQVFIMIGLCALGAGITIIATQGAEFHPISRFALFTNIRAGAFLAGVLTLLLHYAMLARRRDEYDWVRGFLGFMQVVISLFIFELLTAETWSFFGKMATLRSVHYSQNMRQMTLSVVWLVYSFLLIGFGIWKRVRTVRFVAILLYAIAILKVFISDLSFLDQLPRIFSFAGLALILFATSYLYQRYKNLILDSEDTAETPLPSS